MFSGAVVTQDVPISSNVELDKGDPSYCGKSYSFVSPVLQPYVDFPINALPQVVFSDPNNWEILDGTYSVTLNMYLDD